MPGWRCAFAALVLALVVPGAARAQTSETPVDTPAQGDPEPPVIEYDLSGPRLGATFDPEGEVSSQFGWHFEHQAAPGKRGPWFIVETVLLVGGVESNTFIPTTTLVFGLRLPNSFELGVGPSVRWWGPVSTSVVAAAGHSFRVGGIRVPVNLAVAMTERGEGRWTLITGWAIRQKADQFEEGESWR